MLLADFQCEPEENGINREAGLQQLESGQEEPDGAVEVIRPVKKLALSSDSLPDSVCGSESPIQVRWPSDASDTGVSMGSISSVAAEEFEGEGETEDMSDAQGQTSPTLR